MVDNCSEAALEVTAAVTESSTAQITRGLNDRHQQFTDDLAQSRDNKEASKDEYSYTDFSNTVHTVDQNKDLNSYAVKKVKLS